MTTIVRAAGAVGLVLALAGAGPAGMPEIQPDSYSDYDGGLPIASSTSSEDRADQVVRTVSSQTTLEADELEQARPFVEDYCECGGAEQAVQKVLLEAVKMGCRKDCFYETAKCMRDGVENGLSVERTEEAVMATLTEVEAWCEKQGFDMSGAEVGEQLRFAFSSKLSAALHPLP